MYTCSGLARTQVYVVGFGVFGPAPNSFCRQQDEATKTTDILPCLDWESWGLPGSFLAWRPETVTQIYSVGKGVAKWKVASVNDVICWSHHTTSKKQVRSSGLWNSYFLVPAIQSDSWFKHSQERQDIGPLGWSVNEFQAIPCPWANCNIWPICPIQSGQKPGYLCRIHVLGNVVVVIGEWISCVWCWQRLWEFVLFLCMQWRGNMNITCQRHGFFGESCQHYSAIMQHSLLCFRSSLVIIPLWVALARQIRGKV